MTTATSQENKNYLDRHKSYKLEQEFFENSLYGATRYAYGKYIQAKNPAINDDFSNFKDDAAAMAAIAGLRADYMSGENELLSFINKNTQIQSRHQRSWNWAIITTIKNGMASVSKSMK